MNPLVSIIIPTYNRADLLRETLLNVVAQSFTDWECIVVDDHSTDHTAQMMAQWVETDKRFKYFLKPADRPKNAAASRNIGLRHAQGKYIQFLDSDDLMHSHKLYEQIKRLKNQSQATLATCAWGFFQKTDQPFELFENCADYRDFVNPKDYFDLIGAVGGFYPIHSFLTTKAHIEKNGFFNENLTLNDDGEFFFRQIIAAEQLLFCSETYVLYRMPVQHAGKLSTLDSSAKAIDLIKSWQLIETRYRQKYTESNAAYLERKKKSIYFELKKRYPKIVRQNKDFFAQQIQEDTLFLRGKKWSKKLKRYLKKFFI